MRFRKLPSSVEDFFARAIEPHRVVPAGHYREPVRNLAVPAAELNSDRSVHTFLGRDIVERVSVEFVFLIVAFGIVEADGPEAVDRYVFDRKLIVSLPVVLRRSDIKISGVLWRIAALGGSCRNEAIDWINFVLCSEGVAGIGQSRAQNDERVAHFLLTNRVPFWHLKLTRASGLLDPDRVL